MFDLFDKFNVHCYRGESLRDKNRKSMFKPFWNISKMIYSWVEIFFKFEKVYFRTYKKGKWRIENRKSGRMQSGKEENKFFVYFME